MGFLNLFRGKIALMDYIGVIFVSFCVKTTKKNGKFEENIFSKFSFIKLNYKYVQLRWIRADEFLNL